VAWQSPENQVEETKCESRAQQSSVRRPMHVMSASESNRRGGEFNEGYRQTNKQRTSGRPSLAKRQRVIPRHEEYQGLGDKTEPEARKNGHQVQLHP